MLAAFVCVVRVISDVLLPEGFIPDDFFSTARTIGDNTVLSKWMRRQACLRLEAICSFCVPIPWEKRSRHSDQLWDSGAAYTAADGDTITVADISMTALSS